MVDWEAHLATALARYEERQHDVPTDPHGRQGRLTQLGNAAGAVALSLLMLGRDGQATGWFGRAAEHYRESWVDAPPGSWGRPIGSVKSRLMAGDQAGAEADARWALDEGAALSAGPIGRYAAVLALLTLARDAEALPLAEGLRDREDFPGPVADALRALASADADAYASAVREVLRSFEGRDAYLEDIPIADTVLVLQALARDRSLQVPLSSALLPV